MSQLINVLSGSTASLHWWQYGFFSRSPSPFPFSCTSCAFGAVLGFFVTAPADGGAFLFPFPPPLATGTSSGGGVSTSKSLSARDAGELVVFVSVGTESAIGEDATDMEKGTMSRCRECGEDKYVRIE